MVEYVSRFDPVWKLLVRLRPLGFIDQLQPLSKLRSTVRMVAFWLSITLPVTYVPILWNGLSPTGTYLLIGMLLLNIAAAIVGHDHRR